MLLLWTGIALYYLILIEVIYPIADAVMRVVAEGRRA